ncbi:unnamed protein product [Prorocentrum cordatum]|uniref:Uncharacterized protein n=1 Tax=Prorocentrum cordatum TaxID=2364126 RepID=A0ABN9QTB6_9DINO|nr:unnamed protein product [Polarella glacialis]
MARAPPHAPRSLLAAARAAPNKTNKKNSAGSSGRQAQESQQARAPKTPAFALRGVFAPSGGRRGKMPVPEQGAALCSLTAPAQSCPALPGPERTTALSSSKQWTRILERVARATLAETLRFLKHRLGWTQGSAHSSSPSVPSCPGRTARQRHVSPTPAGQISKTPRRLY